MSNLSRKTLEHNLKHCPDAAPWARAEWLRQWKELTGKEWGE